MKQSIFTIGLIVCLMFTSGSSEALPISESMYGTIAYMNGPIQSYGGEDSYETLFDWSEGEGHAPPGWLHRTVLQTILDDHYLADFSTGFEEKPPGSDERYLFEEGSRAATKFKIPGYDGGEAGDPMQESATMIFLGTGLLGLAGYGRRVKK